MALSIFTSLCSHHHHPSPEIFLSCNTEALYPLISNSSSPWQPPFLFLSLNLATPGVCCSVAQSCPTLCDPMDCSTPGFPVLHHLPELAQTHVHRVGDAIQPSHPLSSPSLPVFNLSQHQGLFQSQLFSSGGQSIGASASASVLLMKFRFDFL